MPIDMSALTAPKRKTTTTPRKTTAATTDTRSTREMRREGLDGLGQTGQGILLITGQYADAGAVGRYWPPIAKELADLAETNETIATVADFLVKTGPYTALITAIMPLALQIAANHKMVNAAQMSGFGVVPPEVLEAQMKAEVMQMQADAIRQQQQAQQDMQKAMADLERAQTQQFQQNEPAEVAK